MGPYPGCLQLLLCPRSVGRRQSSAAPWDGGCSISGGVVGGLGAFWGGGCYGAGSGSMRMSIVVWLRGFAVAGGGACLDRVAWRGFEVFQ